MQRFMFKPELWFFQLDFLFLTEKLTYYDFVLSKDSCHVLETLRFPRNYGMNCQMCDWWTEIQPYIIQSKMVAFLQRASSSSPLFCTLLSNLELLRKNFLAASGLQFWVDSFLIRLSNKFRNTIRELKSHRNDAIIVTQNEVTSLGLCRSKPLMLQHSFHLYGEFIRITNFRLLVSTHILNYI